MDEAHNDETVLAAVRRAGETNQLGDELEALRAVGHALLTQVPLGELALSFVRSRTRRGLETAVAELARSIAATTNDKETERRREHARLALTGIVRACIAIATPPAQVEGFMALRTALSPKPPPPSSSSLRLQRTAFDDDDVAPLAVPYDDTTTPDDVPPLAALAAYIERGAYASWVEGAADRSELFCEELLAGIEAARSFAAPISLCARLYEAQRSGTDGPILVELEDAPQNLGRIEPFEATLELAREGDAVRVTIHDPDCEISEVRCEEEAGRRDGAAITARVTGVRQLRLRVAGGRSQVVEVALFIV